MKKEYINMNALQKRFEFLFQEFKNIYISFSGGKDSGVLLNLLLDYRNKYASDRVIGVFHHNMTAFPCHGLSGKRWFVSGCAYAIYFVKLVFLDMFKTVTTCNTKYHYTCGLALQQDFDWLVDLPKERVLRKSNNVEIVFEEQDFDGFLNKLKKYPDIEYLGEVIEHSWGATGDSVLRFGRSYRRGWRGYENGAKAFSCFQHDNGRNLCENGRFRGGLNKTYEQLNFRKKKMVLWNLIKTTAISKWKK